MRTPDLFLLSLVGPACGSALSTTHDAAPEAAGPPDAATVDASPPAAERAPAYGLFQLYGDEYRQFRAAMGFSLPDYWSFVDRHVARLDVRFTRTNTLLIWALVEPPLG